MTIEKQLLEAIEPIIDEVVSVNKRIDELTLQKGEPGVGIKSITQEIPEKFEIELDDGSIAIVDLPTGESGSPGQDGAPGQDGEPGAGIDTKSWEPGVYRDGSIVQHNIGQYFKAVKDTAENPNESADWERIGGAGLRFAKSFKPDNVYQNGDLFVKDFGLFGMFDGEVKLLAGRGPKGEKGEPGKAVNGKDGKDGSEIVAFESKGLKAVLLTKAADGELNSHTIDFGDVVQQQIDELRKEFGELSYDEVFDVVNKSLLNHTADESAVPMSFYRGRWDISNNYVLGDVITFGSKLYAVKKSNSAQMPTGGSITNPLAGSEFWDEIKVGGGGSSSGGSANAAGTQGPAGPQGPVGPQGAVGPAGPAGATGPQGIQGNQGVAGLGITFKSRIATVGDLPATADQGDMYIVDTTGDAWIWSDSVGHFENAGPIVGPKGEQGPTGATGSTGPQGQAGVIGPQGPQGLPGPNAVSTDAGNTATLGTDGKVFVPTGSGGGSGAYLPLAGGTMTGPIAMPSGTVMTYTSSYSMFTATGGVSFRAAAVDLIAFTNSGIYGYKPFITPTTGIGISFGAGGGYFSKVGQGIGAYVAGALKLTIDAAAHTSTVPIVLPADPTTDLQAATKKYVDILGAKVTALEARIAALETP